MKIANAIADAIWTAVVFLWNAPSRYIAYCARLQREDDERWEKMTDEERQTEIADRSW